MRHRKWWVGVFGVALAANSGCRLFCDGYCDRRDRDHSCCAPAAVAPAPVYGGQCCTPPTASYQHPVPCQ